MDKCILLFDCGACQRMGRATHVDVGLGLWLWYVLGRTNIIVIFMEM